MVGWRGGKTVMARSAARSDLSSDPPPALLPTLLPIQSTMEAVPIIIRKDFKKASNKMEQQREEMKQ